MDVRHVIISLTLFIFAGGRAFAADPTEFASVLPTVGSTTGIAVAQATPAEEQRRRDEYIRRALQPIEDPALTGHKERSTGTGFYVAEHFLLTNYHVVRECAVSTAEPGENDAQRAVVTIAATDQAHDLAILRSPQAAPGAAVLEAAPGRVDASDLYLVGYPMHGLANRRPILTSAVARPEALATADSFFQVAVEIHPGHSGSPLLDEFGAVVGIMTKGVDTVTTYEKTGRIVKGIGLAVPTTVILGFLSVHGVPYQSATPRATVMPGDRLLEARPFVTRVGCWQ